jgi:hypothetical protein
VLCVFLDVWNLDKCCVFFWMCGTRTSAVCLSGCVGLRKVMCVCLFIYCIWTITWMCGTRTRAVCLSGCVELRQVLCVFLDVWDSDKCCVFVWKCGTRISAVCFSGCVGLRQVLCVFLDVCDLV